MAKADRRKIQPYISVENDRWVRHAMVDSDMDVSKFFDKLLTCLRTGQIRLPSDQFPNVKIDQNPVQKSQDSSNSMMIVTSDSY